MARFQPSGKAPARFNDPTDLLTVVGSNLGLGVTLVCS